MRVALRRQGVRSQDSVLIVRTGAQVLENRCVDVPLAIEMELIDLVRIRESLLLDEMGVQQIRICKRLSREALAGNTQRNEARNADPTVAGIGPAGRNSGHGEIPRIGASCHRVLCDIRVKCSQELVVAAVPLYVVTDLFEQRRRKLLGVLVLADVIRVQLVVGREVGEYAILVERAAGDGVGAEVPADLTALRMALTCRTAHRQS